MIGSNAEISFNVDSTLSLETLWNYYQFFPNDAQKEAIKFVNGPLYITAGPGSGKTRVLLWRTLNLIVFHGVKPEEIFLSTFTEKAAHQLKEGLRGLLGYATNINGVQYDLSKMYIGTVHSLCRRILTDRRIFLQDYHENPMPGLMDELGQYFHVARNRNWWRIGDVLGLGEEDDQNEVINQIFGTQRLAKHEAVTRCISFFNRCSEECIDPSEVIAYLGDPDDEIETFFENLGLDLEDVIDAYLLYSGYLHTLQLNEKIKKTDFSLLQQEAYKVLLEQDSTIEKFRYVIIDEYQDTNRIQEKIFFKLAEGSHNLCVVGDDDQALYRFRGATVENFVDFPARCKRYFNRDPRRVSLSLNYRSRENIIKFYSQFIKQTDWRRHESDGGGHYRVIDKEIKAENTNDGLSVVASTPAAPISVCREIAFLVKRLINHGKVEDPNQIAFLFPSLKSVAVGRMQQALEELGLRVYAPRAGRFLDVVESCDVFGLIGLIMGPPETQKGWGGDYGNFVRWMDAIENNAKELVRADPALARFVDDKREEVNTACADFLVLKRTAERENWSMKESFNVAQMKRKLYNTSGLSETGKKLLGSRYLDGIIERRELEGNPYTLEYVIKRVTSLDWSLLDLFYRMTGFSHFKHMFNLAENNEDEGPICNLSLITQYLARFVDEFLPILTADLIVDKIFHQVFYFSFLFAIFRLGDSEYEDAEDPFPKGRIPFLTIHQAKGLEFPVVVLGNPYRQLKDADFVEKSTFPFNENINGEPLSRQPEFDAMRIFYVALSRAQNLLVIAHFRGRGQRMNQPFKNLLDDNFARIPDLDLETVPTYKARQHDLPRMYSYTADFLSYKKCPRQYMAFRKYEFVPSRAQTMFFGNLVHRTLEDLHHEVIRRRKDQEDGI